MNNYEFQPFTGNTNYLGLNPFYQTEKFTLGGPQAYQPVEYVMRSDYELPNNVVNNNPILGPRVNVNNYALPKGLSTTEIKSGENRLNPNANQQNQFQGGQFVDTYNLVKY